MEMAIIGAILAAIKGGIETYSWAQEKGYVGGSTGWVPAAQELVAFLDRGKGLLVSVMSTPEAMDALATLPQGELEAEIQRRLYPTSLRTKLNAWRASQGLPPLPA